jgi:plasminogen activator inhibitor 1 RNA-binding protein
MAEFGVSISNKFAFLDDDAPAPKKEVKTVKKAETKPKPHSRPESARNERGNDRNERNNNGGARGGRGRGGRGGRGGKGGKGRGGKREFDRQSGTGRDKSVRKEGHGRGGWGEEGAQGDRPRYNNRRRNEQNQEDTTASTDKPEEVAKTEEGDAETPVVEAEAAPVEPEEPEDTSVTYEEFLAQKAANVVEDDLREARSVQNDGRFKGSALEKSDEIDFQLELGSGVKSCKKSRKQAAKKNVSLDEFVAKGPSSRGRGGRGRGRGGKGGRGYRPPQLNDQQFPKLG